MRQFPRENFTLGVPCQAKNLDDLITEANMPAQMSSRKTPQKPMQAIDTPLATPNPIVMFKKSISTSLNASQSKAKLEEKRMIKLCKQRPLKDEILSSKTSGGKEERKERKPKKQAQPRNIQDPNPVKDETSEKTLEKGIIYFFFQPRVNIEEPHDLADVARNYFVLRPVLPGHDFGTYENFIGTDTECRLMVFPKKRFPTSGNERDMGFVEDVGHSMRYLQRKFLSKETYNTSSMGERTKQAARLYAEGVYAIQSTKHASCLVYVLTIPTEIGNTQQKFGLQAHGKWIVQSKNPAYPSPPYARLIKDPEFPGWLRERFHNLRWVPLEPELINYSSSQFVMIGEARNDLAKTTASGSGKRAVDRVVGRKRRTKPGGNSSNALQKIYQDLVLDAQKLPKVRTTWEGSPDG